MTEEYNYNCPVEQPVFCPNDDDGSINFNFEPSKLMDPGDSAPEDRCDGNEWMDSLIENDNISITSAFLPQDHHGTPSSSMHVEFSEIRLPTNETSTEDEEPLSLSQETYADFNAQSGGALSYLQEAIDTVEMNEDSFSSSTSSEKQAGSWWQEETVGVDDVAPYNLEAAITTKTNVGALFPKGTSTEYGATSFRPTSLSSQGNDATKKQQCQHGEETMMKTKMALSEAYEQLNTATQRTSRTRELIRKSVLSYKTASFSSNINTFKNPVPPPSTVPKMENSKTAASLNRNTNGNDVKNYVSPHGVLGTEELRRALRIKKSTTISGVAPRRLQMKSNSSAPLPKNVRASMRTRKQRLTYLRRLAHQVLHDERCND